MFAVLRPNKEGLTITIAFLNGKERVNQPVQLSYFSDMLCVWAYVSQIRLDELKEKLGDRINITYHFVTLFGCTEKRIGEGWRTRGGFDGFSDHVVDVCHGFSHVEVNPEVWKACIPRSSAVSHLFLKAVQILEEDGIVPRDSVTAYANRTTFEELAWRVRLSFFREARDIGQISNLLDVAGEMGLPVPAIRDQIENGAAMAALCSDMEQKEIHKLEGSPTYLLNNGRQKLYGNVGYRIIEANILELLERPEDRASWC